MIGGCLICNIKLSLPWFDIWDSQTDFTLDRGYEMKTGTTSLLLGLAMLVSLAGSASAQETKIKWFGHSAFSITTPNGWQTCQVTLPQQLRVSRLRRRAYQFMDSALDTGYRLPRRLLLVDRKQLALLFANVRLESIGELH